MIWPFNQFAIRRVNRQLSRLTWERGMCSNQPRLCETAYDPKIMALMERKAILEQTALVSLPLDFICHTCKRRHRENVTPARLMGAYGDWYSKHPEETGHRTETFIGKRILPSGLGILDRIYNAMEAAPWWLTYAPNADIKTAHGASAAMTITLASLATSATIVAGRESTVVDNSANLYLDYGLAALITVGTTPTTNTLIQVWLYGSRNDAFLYPDLGAATTLTGADAAATWTTAEIRNAAMRLWADALQVGTTSNRVYTLGSAGIGESFRYVLPKKWGIWVGHSTGVNLNATGTNFVISQTGLYATG